MDTGTFRGIITGLLILAFIGITLWAYSRRRKPDFDEAANLPFADDDDQPNHETHHSPVERTGGDASRHVDSRNDKGDKNI